MNDIEALETLGAAKVTRFEEVTVIYKHLAKKYHPDKFPGDQAAHARFTSINAAYNHLKERHLKNELKLPIGSSPFLDIDPSIFPELIDDAIFEEIIEYFIDLGPPPLKPVLKHLKKNIDKKTILSLIINYGLEIPKKFVKAISKTKKKKKKKRPRVLSSRLYIHRPDYNLFLEADSSMQKSMALRCILETTRTCPRTGKPKTTNETADLCFPKGLDPTGQIALGGSLWDIEIADLGFTSLNSPADLIIHTRPQSSSGREVREGPVQTNVHTPVQKQDPLKNLWKRGNVFSD